VEFVIAIVILAAVAAFVAVPLRRRPGAEAPAEDPRRADLEARKEALYRQIRDAELDRAQGKISNADWRRLDAELRREAIEVLKALDG
jgi:cytochrome c-type biogenesis protein CcmI